MAPATDETAETIKSKIMNTNETEPKSYWKQKTIAQIEQLKNGRWLGSDVIWQDKESCNTQLDEILRYFRHEKERPEWHDRTWTNADCDFFVNLILS